MFVWPTHVQAAGATGATGSEAGGAALAVDLAEAVHDDGQEDQGTHERVGVAVIGLDLDEAVFDEHEDGSAHEDSQAGDDATGEAGAADDGDGVFGTYLGAMSLGWAPAGHVSREFACLKMSCGSHGERVRGRVAVGKAVVASIPHLIDTQ
jgi:hypothetical protein